MPSLGKNIPHDSAKGHVAGESIYIDDMPFARNELVVDFFWSPVAHGKIKELDLSAAKKVPGIVGLYTYKDLGGTNLFGPSIKDEVLLVEDTCEFIGHPIVVIAAENSQAAKAAKSCIKIEIDELKPILSIEEAIARKNFIGPPRTIRTGNPEAGFAAAQHVLEGSFFSGGQEHFYLESQAAIAYPGEHGQLVVHSSTQNPTEVQDVIAHVLGLKQNQVVVTTKRMGGGFGGKECQATHPAAMASLVALKTKRPARIVLDVDTDMQVTGKRHPFHNRYKVGFTGDGKITALKIALYSDGGAACDLSLAVMSKALLHAENAYFVDNAEFTGTICKTNYPPNTAFRGFGCPQAVANMENIIEEIAAFLKKDALDIRLLNIYGVEERNLTPYGQIVTNNTLAKLFSELERSADYRNRMAQVKAFNQSSKTHLKGLSLIPVKFGVSFGQKHMNQGSALVNLYQDGTIQVSTGATEMGQGVNTNIRQLVADEFDIPVDSVLVMPTSTEKNNNSSPTAASSATDLNGQAAVNACEKIRERLVVSAGHYFNSVDPALSSSAHEIVFENGQVFDRRNPEAKLTFAKLVQRAYLDKVSLGERGFHAHQGLHFDWESGSDKTGSGIPYLYFTFGCAVASVIIDRFTGDLKIERVDVLMDIGRSINPGVSRGQIAGAFVQGMGWVTTEELKYSDKGALLSHSPTTYKIPNIQDLPDVFKIDWIENNENTVNLKGTKAVGEPPFVLGAAVWTAVKHALSFVSKDQVARLRLPATNEEILTRLTQYEKLQAGAEVQLKQPALLP
jgi:xanthine dehydrogenase large subunit